MPIPSVFLDHICSYILWQVLTVHQISHCEVKTAHEFWGVKMVVKARRAIVMLIVMLLDRQYL